MKMNETFASLFRNDGLNFETQEGCHFDAIAKGMNVEKEFARNSWNNDKECYEILECAESSRFSGDPVRYIFPDNSVIVVIGDGWDFEGDKPFTWRG